ncbi:MFS transporter [bacterium]|nr:MFS transporter [bacterium]
MDSKNIQKHAPARLAWTVWGLGAALYLFGFFQRVAPGVMTAELSLDFHLSAAALGNLSAFYFYSYVAMQIPTGILADLWGPRRLLTMGALIAGLGTILFSIANTEYLAGIGRLLIGGSVAVAFVGMLKLAHHWFIPRQFALASGMALFVGIVGAVFAGVPLQIFVSNFGWRLAMGFSAIFPILTALMIWWIVRDDPSQKGFSSYVKTTPGIQTNAWRQSWQGLKEVFHYKNTIILSLVPNGLVGSILAFSGLWGVPFLTSHRNFSKSDAAATCSAILIAWAIGGPLFGSFSDKIGNRKPLYIIGCGIIAGCWALIAFFPKMPLFLLIGLLMILGFATGCMIIGFAFGKESIPAHLAGTVSGVINMGVMIGPMIMQPAIGYILDLKWAGHMLNDTKIYPLEAFQAGFGLMAIWSTFSLIMIFFAKETFCQPFEAIAKGLLAKKSDG